jgi:hypothetical protein
MTIAFTGLLAGAMSDSVTAAIPAARSGPDRAVLARRHIPRLGCAQPPALHLLRFEDGSAQLRCGRDLLVRISSPG